MQEKWPEPFVEPATPTPGSAGAGDEGLPHAPRVRFPDGRTAAEQPRWRQDFPIDWPRDHFVSRREFTRFLVLTSLAFTAGQFWIGLEAMRAQKQRFQPKALARVDELPVGRSLLFNYPGDHDPNLLVHLSQDQFVAYGQRCTHLQCAVTPRPELGQFHCPCHEGWFDMASGRPLAGPPRRPLPKVVLEIRDGTIYAVGVEERTV